MRNPLRKIKNPFRKRHHAPVARALCPDRPAGRRGALWARTDKGIVRGAGHSPNDGPGTRKDLHEAWARGRGHTGKPVR